MTGIHSKESKMVRIMIFVGLKIPEIAVMAIVPYWIGKFFDISKN